jgi:hypothetical protein
MKTRKFDRRRAPRQLINRVAQIRLDPDAPPHECTIADISASGVRLNVEGLDVPEEFVLLITGHGVRKECSYRVVWRMGDEIGASFIGFVRRPDPPPGYLESRPPEPAQGAVPEAITT